MTNLKLEDLTYAELKNKSGGVAPIVYAAGWASITLASLATAYYKGYSDAENERCYDE